MADLNRVPAILFELELSDSFTFNWVAIPVYDSQN